MITLPLEKMSVEEKIRVMESIWEYLCETADGSITPDWHGTVVSGREEDLVSGKDEILDWEVAKSRISEELK